MKTNGELRARICSLEIQLDRSKREIEQQREEFLSKGAKATNMLCDADARIAELEQKLCNSLDAERAANVLVSNLEAQQAVLVEALTEYMAAYNEHWERGMPILEPMGDSALAAVKTAALINGLTEAETNVTASVAGLMQQEQWIVKPAGQEGSEK